MQKTFWFLLLSIFLCAQSWGAENKLSNSFSPQLRSFMDDHPAALKLLNDAISNAFSTRTVRFYYFYTNDESEARASHYYLDVADLPHVIIQVRENQPVIDQFFLAFFETINSMGERQFAEIRNAAIKGSISKHQYAMAILKIEFKAAQRTRDAIKTLKFTEKEKRESLLYKSIVETSDDFDQFVKNPNYDYYKLEYDVIRKPRESEKNGDAPK